MQVFSVSSRAAFCANLGTELESVLHHGECHRRRCMGPHDTPHGLAFGRVTFPLMVSWLKGIALTTPRSCHLVGENPGTLLDPGTFTDS